MVRSEAGDSTTYRRVARRVEDILDAAREREGRGQSLALDIDAKFRLEDRGAVQFQVASAILEEVEGLREEEVVGELLSLGLAAVLGGAATSDGVRRLRACLQDSAPVDNLPEDEEWARGGLPGPQVPEHRVLN